MRSWASVKCAFSNRARPVRRCRCSTARMSPPFIIAASAPINCRSRPGSRTRITRIRRMPRRCWGCRRIRRGCRTTASRASSASLARAWITFPRGRSPSAPRRTSPAMILRVSSCAPMRRVTTHSSRSRKTGPWSPGPVAGVSLPTRGRGPWRGHLMRA